MSAEGYKAQPLSDELEGRIRDRLLLERGEAERNPLKRAVCAARASALEWVLNEARALVESVPEFPAQPGALGKYDACPNCGHVHLDERRCNFPYAKDRECLCERKVPA